jgi:hypothetical protein
MCRHHEEPDRLTDAHGADEYDGDLEQVGRILHRLDLDQAEIVRLRTETRAVLAELAA